MRLRIPLLTILALISVAPLAQADDFSSTNFTLQDPIIAEPASYGTSSNYGLWGVIPNIAPTSGTSTNFGVNPGFLAFSNITMPTLSATASTTELDLSWSAAVGGSTVTYEPGYATTLGGPYTFAAAQTTRTATIGGLVASTPYYLIIRVKEQSGGALLGYSNELAISTLAVSAPAEDDDGGGSGGSIGTVPPPVGWIYGPTGLVPATGAGSSTIGILLPGESVTVAEPLVRQFGYVVTIDGELEFPIPEAAVELWRLNAETDMFELWPSEELGLVSTDAFGLYSFIVPPGTYRLKASASGYLDYSGPAVVVGATGELEQRIELVKAVKTDVPWPWFFVILLMGASLAGLIIFLMLRFVLRR
jgi:hypothetical protein